MTGQHKNWYQAPSALFAVSLIVATVLVWTSWDWTDILRKETDYFCFNYEVKPKDGYVVTEYDAQEHQDCAGKGASGGLMVRVELRGYPRMLKQLKNIERQKGSLPLEKTLGDYKSGSHDINVTDPQTTLEHIDRRFKKLVVVGSKEDVRAEGAERSTQPKVEPSVVKVNVEKIVDQQLSVKANIVGEPGEGFLLGEHVTKPEQVWVRVPESRTTEYDGVETVALDISNLQEDHTFRDVRLELPEFTQLRGDEFKELRADQPPVVEVTVKLLPKRKWVLLEPVKVTLQNSRLPGYRLRIEPEYVAVQVRMDAHRDADRVKGIRVHVDASESRAEPDKPHEATVTLSREPAWVDRDKDIVVEPREVRLVYEKLPEE